MPFSDKSTAELAQIAASGGGFRLDVESRSTEELIEIAAAAKKGRAPVYFGGAATRYIDDLIRIAAAGRGYVIFED